MHPQWIFISITEVHYADNGKGSETSTTSDGAALPLTYKYSPHSILLKVCPYKTPEVFSLDVQDYAKDPSANGISGDARAAPDHRYESCLCWAAALCNQRQTPAVPCPGGVHGLCPVLACSQRKLCAWGGLLPPSPSPGQGRGPGWGRGPGRSGGGARAA